MKFTQNLKTYFARVIVLAVMVSIIAPVSPVTAETTVDVSNNSNASESENTGNYYLQRDTEIDQSNNSQINTSITQQSDTGNNQVKDNTGNVDIQTGDITTNSRVNNVAGFNAAHLEQCDDHEAHLANLHNGSESDNGIHVSKEVHTNTQQINDTDVNTTHVTEANTGENSATDNHGNVSITTGSIDDHSQTTTATGSNVFYEELAGSDNIAVVNEKNGSGSKNYIGVNLIDEQTVHAENNVRVTNNDYKDLNTGGNDCKDNYGDCYVRTGDISSTSDTDTTAGSNITAKVKTPKGAPVPEEPVEEPTKPSQDKEIDKPTDDGDIIDGIRKTIPKVIAAINPDVEGEVMGAAMLPMTGIGTPAEMTWSQVLLGILILAGGLLLRKLTDRYLGDEPSLK